MDLIIKSIPSTDRDIIIQHRLSKRGEEISKLLQMDDKLKSSPSKERVYVRFVNKTCRYADVFWVDFDGLPVLYSTLEPNNHIDIDTFVNHPWIFRDHTTRDRLATNNNASHFSPPSWKELLRRSFGEAREGLPQHRIIVMITLPLYGLRERCIQVVRDNILLNLDVEELPETLLELEEMLPKSVIDDLIKVLFQKDGVYID